MMKRNPEIGLVGIPFDAYSSFLDGPGLAPQEIRKALHSTSSNWSTESGLDLEDQIQWKDLGDIEISNDEKGFFSIEKQISQLLEQSQRIVSMGGDHSITYPILKAHAEKFPEITLVHLDAHPDLYDIFDDNPYSNACPFARIMEEELVQSLVQIGIRTLNKPQKDQADRFNVQIYEMTNWNPQKMPEIIGPVYLSLDMDVLDPAYAPGVSHHAPGGLSSRDVIHLIQRLQGPLIGADVVEYNPKRDINNMTAMVAAKLIKEIIGKMISRTMSWSKGGEK
jgi:agmatinase